MEQQCLLLAIPLSILVLHSCREHTKNVIIIRNSEFRVRNVIFVDVYLLFVSNIFYGSIERYSITEQCIKAILIEQTFAFIL